MQTWSYRPKYTRYTSSFRNDSNPLVWQPANDGQQPSYIDW